MSNLLEQASLVMIPSGYKEDIVYSEIPIDGSGDLQLTRASNGTRINSAGLVEVCPWNIMTYSEQFQNADWSGGGLGKPTMTDNFAEAPNGTITASKMEAASDQYQMKQENAQENTQMNLSVWLRTNTGTKTIQLFLNNAATASQNITVTTTWTRYEISGLVTSLSGGGRNGLNTLEALTSGAYILVWGFQLSVGLSAKPYFPTTDRLNVPRLTYQNGGGGCPSLLLEKQSTNSAFPSEDFSGYTGSGATIVTNQATSPDGTTNADLIYPATNGNFAGKYINIANSTTGVVSCFVKQASKRYAIIGTDNNSLYTCIFDLQTATVVYQATNYTGKIESVGNGWYRISAVYTSSSAAAYPFIGVADNSSGGVVVDGTNGLYIWGYQYELNSSYPTSYIPTTSSSATRVADACSKTGISSLIGQTEGVLFCDFNWEQKEGVFFINSISDGTTNNDIFMAFGSSANNRIRFSIASGGVNYVNEDSAVLSSGRYKIAFAYASNDAVVYINGTQLFTDSSVTVPATSAFKFLRANDTLGFNGTINQQALFPTRLTNAELASLTTL